MPGSGHLRIRATGAPVPLQAHPPIALWRPEPGADREDNSHERGLGMKWVIAPALCLALGSAARAAAPESPPARAPAAPPVASAPLREYVRVVQRPYLRVGLTVTVVDRDGKPVRGLSRGDFLVREDGDEAELVDFGVEAERRDRPLSVAVLLDLSYSMGSQVKKVREAAEALLASLRPGDEIRVAKFNDELTVLQDFTGDPGDPAKTLKRIGAASGGTAIFRSLDWTLRDLRTRPGRKVILVEAVAHDQIGRASCRERV